MTSPGRARARAGTRRAPERRGGRSRGNGLDGLLMLGGGGVLTIVVAGLIVFLPGDDSGTTNSTGSSVAISAPADPAAPSDTEEEIPDGFKPANAAGVFGAVPGDWTVKAARREPSPSPARRAAGRTSSSSRCRSRTR